MPVTICEQAYRMTCYPKVNKLLANRRLSIKCYHNRFMLGNESLNCIFVIYSTWASTNDKYSFTFKDILWSPISFTITFKEVSCCVQGVCIIFFTAFNFKVVNSREYIFLTKPVIAAFLECKLDEYRIFQTRNNKGLSPNRTYFSKVENKFE